MYKPPLPQDDEPIDVPEFSYPARRRRAQQAASALPRRVPGDYRTDERPGEPKIRRASLLHEQQEKQARLEAATHEEAGKSKASRNPTPEKPGLRGESGKSRGVSNRAPAPETSRLRERERSETGKSRAIRNPVPATPRPRNGAETDKSRAIRSPVPVTPRPRSGTETGKILVTPGRRSSDVYAPRIATRPQRGSAGTRSHPSYVRHARPRSLFTRRQVITGAILLVVMLALFIPIALIGSHRVALFSMSTTPSANNTQSAFNGQSDPHHQLVITPQDTDHPAPPVFATSAYLLDAGTGNTVYAYHPFQRLPMLSTTKLMTAALAIEQGGNLDRRITITNAMSADISQLSPDSALFGVKKGEIYTLRDLLYGLLFVSGNDAAIAIADELGGNLPHFVSEMNAKAQQLGLYDTHFVNPHGLLDTGQYSCAHDLALLGKYAMSLPVLHQISGASAYHIPQGGNHKERFLINENQFLWWYPNVDGGKTGYDGQSDFIQVMSVTRNHHHLIGVVMHTNNWWTDMRDLMNWGFDSFSWISPRDVDAQRTIPYDYLWNYFARDTKEYTVPTADNGRYYVYTGYSITGPIMTYFDAHGGLQTFGFPLKMVTAPSASHITQQFEHGTIQCDQSTNQCQQT